MSKKLSFGFHSILSLIRVNPSKIVEIFLDDKRDDARMRDLKKLLDEKNIKYHLYSQERLDQLLPKEKHQGVIARVSDQGEKFYTLEDIVEKDNDNDPLILILDGIEDPHNLGACFRVADAMAVDAILSP